MGINNVYIIAEMSANHAGSLENALEIVRQSKRAGADCVKIQTYTPDTITMNCKNEWFQIKGGLWDGLTFYDLYKDAFTPWEWHKPIKEECEKVGIDFLSTPFDKTAVDYLEELGVTAFKIASYELVDIPLIEYAAQKRKRMILSCGMGTRDEIYDAIQACYKMNNHDIILLKCCSEYPARYEDMNLASINMMKREFNVPVGLSDHSEGYLADVMAVALGASVIEKHVCLSKSIKNPDSEFSMEMQDFEQMVMQVRLAEKIVGIETYELTEKEKEGLGGRRSLFVTEDIAKDEIITEKNIRSIRPSYGLPPKMYKDLLGKKVVCDIEKGTPLSLEMICKESDVDESI